MSGQTIMIVDDDEDIRTCLRDVLELEGYSVVNAKNGREALELLKQPPKPCLILLDLMMPVMDAAAFVAIQKSSAATADIPAVVMSACTNLEARTAPIAVAGFIKKPFDFGMLLETIRRHCG